LNIFSDLASGVSYGLTTVTDATIPQQVNVALNDSAIAALNAADGAQFAIGGSLSQVAVPVPGPVAGAGLPGIDICWRRPSRLVAQEAEGASSHLIKTPDRISPGGRVLRQRRLRRRRIAKPFFRFGPGSGLALSLRDRPLI
jgi:hypothetical protein